MVFVVIFWWHLQVFTIMVSKPNPIDAKQEASLISGARSMPPSPSPWCKISGTITKRQRRQFSRRGGRAHLFCRQGGTCQHSKALRDPPNCCQLQGKEPKRIPRRGKQEKANNLQWKNFARSQAQPTLEFIFLLANCELRQWTEMQRMVFQSNAM